MISELCYNYIVETFLTAGSLSKKNKGRDFLSKTIKTVLSAFGVLMIWGLYLVISGCSMLLLDDEFPDFAFEKTDKELLVVEDALYPSLESSIDQYIADLNEEGSTVYLYIWEEGTAFDLKAVIETYYTENGIGGVLFVGNLPTVWYEQNGFEGHEEFPIDLFFMDLDSTWQDNDKDGIFDYHSALELEIFISRINGTTLELMRYFDKVHKFRTGQMDIDPSAYVFKDNSWEDFKPGSDFGLSRIYNSILINEKKGDTEKANYISKLTTSGAEYVYQWIHSFPPLLVVEGSSSWEYIHTSDIISGNMKGLFYNLFNCSAVRFTEDNLGMTYLMKTDYGIAATGSTKTGGNYYPNAFHYVLSEKGTWGDAFKGWYNYYGVNDDKWFLGMIILGDPMLVLTKEAQKGLKSLSVGIVPPSPDEIEELNKEILDFGYDYSGGSFAEYKNQNPQFFGD